MIWLWAGGLVVAALAAYANSFSGAFVLDDTDGILNNRTIRHLWPFWPALSPPVHSGAGGRPLLNLSFAINYALGGLTVQGYHAFNLAVHILAGLILFGLVRRTLLRPVLQPRFGKNATLLAFAVALLWLLHPLQTASVTYVSQRAESLMGLWYLLTLYGFVRGVESPAPRRWFMLAITACLSGMATKEVMISAPLIVLLYDRTFVAGTFGEAWRRHRRLYLGLGSSWVLLGCLMINLGQRGVGFGHGISGWTYALTECRVIGQYLALSVWPHPLVFDYGIGEAKHPAVEAIPFALLLIPLLGATVIALRRRPALGFVAAWFFMILAPTSSVVPVAGQPMAENRMYLPLAAVAVLIVLGAHSLAGRRSGAAVFVIAAALGLLSARRNTDYRSPLSIWSDTLAKRPQNERAHDSLGNALLDAGRIKEAVQAYTRAVELAPDDPREYYNLGNALVADGRRTDAIARYEQALKLNPDYVEARNNLGAALADSGRLDAAAAQYDLVLNFQPDNADAHYNLGKTYQQMGRLAEAVAQYQEALRLNPDSAGTQNNLGSALAQMGRLPEAIGHFQAAVGLDPRFAEAYRNWGNALLQAGRLPGAIARYESALGLKPGDPVTHTNLGIALLQTGRAPEAVDHFQRALQLGPDYAPAHYWLGNALAQSGRMPQALEQFQAAVRLAPNDAEAQNNLGMALVQTGRLPEAVAHFEEAVRLRPDYATAAGNLADARAALAAQNRRD